MSEKRAIDVRTVEGWDCAIAVEKKALKQVGKDGEVLFTCVRLFCTEDPEGAKLWTGPPRAVPLFCVLAGVNTDEEAEHLKNAFSMHVRLISIAGAAIASLTMSEAWVAHVEGRTVEDAREAMDGKMPRDMPDRKEALVITHAHREFGEGMISCEITHNNKKRILGDWEKRGGVSQGRFLFRPPPEILMRKKELQPQARAIMEIHREFGKAMGISMETVSGPGEGR